MDILPSGGNGINDKQQSKIKDYNMKKALCVFVLFAISTLSGCDSSIRTFSEYGDSYSEIVSIKAHYISKREIAPVYAYTLSHYRDTGDKVFYVFDFVFVSKERYNIGDRLKFVLSMEN